MEHELVRDATATEGVTTCETCAGNTCKHNGVCQEAPTSVGYTCLCAAGFSGDDCSKSGQSCYPGKSLKPEDARKGKPSLQGRSKLCLMCVCVSRCMWNRTLY